MNKILKARLNGELLEIAHYPMNTRRPGETEQGRGKREKNTAVAKQVINRRESRLAFMRTAQANYRAGRDLKCELRFSLEIDENHARRLLHRFHTLRRERYKSEWKKLDRAEKQKRRRQGDDGQYRYMCVCEDHRKDGEPCAVHFHLLLSRNPDHRKRALQGVLDDWAKACGELAGSVLVKTLEGSDVFDDTARYFLKQRREKGKKRWTKSRNHRPPAPPVYKRVPEKKIPDTPPGCILIRANHTENEFGSYGYMICRVVDHRRFMRWWNRFSGEQTKT